jgi:uncharacterized ferritin-like protein (DUF455 family)
MIELRRQALNALATADVAAKLAAVAAIADDIALDCETRIDEPPMLPGRPLLPRLISPREVPQRGLGTVEGRAALIHALAHIEFNAINLALDIVWRFAGMPPAFYRDWMQVAREEALHFALLQAHLKTLGAAYGDFPAHNGLWEMAEKTRAELLARLALVPRTLEARGLDVSPAIRDKLLAVGDPAGAAILDVILRDEIRHVAVGNVWYRHACREHGLDPLTAYATLAERYNAPRLRGPFNREARLAAGFEQAEIDAL